jgi:hypothetical protein
MRLTIAAVLSVIVLSTIVFVATPAQADLLTFSDNACSGSSSGTGSFTACSSYSYINQAYGDTANVDVTYKDLTAENPGVSLQWLKGGFNDLKGVLWAQGGDCCSTARIELAPLGAQSVTLNSFDLGAFSDAIRSTQVQVLDLVTNAVLFSVNPTVGAGDVSSRFFPGVTSFNGLVIEWKNSAYNVGMDNVAFTIGPPPEARLETLVETPTAVVPEPGTLLLLGLGLAALVRVRCRVRERDALDRLGIVHCHR